MGRTDRIIPIDELPDFRVVEGDPDVRGWEVLSADGRTIGEVNNLLIDVEAMKVRYLDVDVNSAVVDTEANRHILIPVGYARVDVADDRVFVDTLDATAVPAIPEYRDEVITRDYENTLRGHFDRGFAVQRDVEGNSVMDADFYGSDIYSSDRFYEGRRNSNRRSDAMVNDDSSEKLQHAETYRADPAPAFADSGSYGARAPVDPRGFGPEIIRDGEIARDGVLDGLGQIREPRSGISAGGHFGSGWSDDEIVRAQGQQDESERIRGL